MIIWRCLLILCASAVGGMSRGDVATAAPQASVLLQDALAASSVNTETSLPADAVIEEPLRLLFADESALQVDEVAGCGAMGAVSPVLIIFMMQILRFSKPRRRGCPVADRQTVTHVTLKVDQHAP